MAAEDGEATETLKDFIINHVNHFYINHIPFDSIKDMSEIYLYFFGTVAYLFSFIMFAYFFYENYKSSLDQAFISLQSSAGDCSTVPIKIQGTYLADTKGYWNSEPEFQQVKAQYALKLTGFEVSSNLQYNNMMQYFYTDLEGVGTRATGHNLAENLLLWMTYVQYYSLQFSITDATFTNISSIGQVQSFSLTGDPSAVFNLDHLVGRLGSSSGVCSAPSYAQFDGANHYVQTTWTNYNEFAATSSCSSAIYADNFAYYQPVDDNIFNVKIDVQSFSVAMAVNMKYIPLSYLVQISFDALPFLYRDVGYTIAEYFDSRYSSMRAIYCIQNTTSIPPSAGYMPESLCFLPYGSTMVLPVFNPFGTSYIQPAACECGKPRSGNSDACNTFNFLVGIVFYKNAANNTNIVKLFEEYSIGALNISAQNISSILSEFGIFSLIENVRTYKDYAAYNRQAYSPSYYTAYSSSNATAEEIAASYSAFCRISSATTTSDVCSMIVFNTYDESTHAVSPYKYQLRNGSCHNSISISSNDWAKLVASPPVQFTQIYYECYDNTQSAIVAAIGIAQGNTQTFLPFFVVLALPILYFILVVIREVPPKAEYKEQEKTEVSEILSLLMLRLRDGKTRGVKKNGVLMGLAKEMIAMAKEEGGYPDSDDEEEEEGEEGDRGTENERTKKGDKRGSKSMSKNRLRVDSDDEFSQTGSISSKYDSASIQGHTEILAAAAEHQSPSHRKAPKTLIIRGNKMIIEDKSQHQPTGVVEQFRHIVNQRNRRKRMDVFTKHLSVQQQDKSSKYYSSNQNRVRVSNHSSDDSRQDPRGLSMSSEAEGAFGRSRMSSAVHFFRRITSTIPGQQNPAHQHHRQQQQQQHQSHQHQLRASRQSDRISDFSNRDSANAETPAPTSFWSSLFGSNQSVKPHKQQEMRDRPSLGATSAGKINSSSSKKIKDPDSSKDKDFAKRAEAYVDLTLYAAPQDVQILNVHILAAKSWKGTVAGAGGGMSQMTSSVRSKKELSPNELNILLNDLVRYLSEALNAPMRLDSTVHNSTNPLHQKKQEAGSMPSVLAVGQTHFRMDSVDGDVYHEITRRDHVAFQQQALPLSTRLTTQVNWVSILEGYDETERSAIVLKLINILSMHASIEYDCAMSDVSLRFGKKVAYNIGDRLVTLYLLEKLVD